MDVVASSAAAPARLDGSVLALSAISDNRTDLLDRLTVAAQGSQPVYATTPLGFFQDEVTLFYPLLVQQLHLKAAFPLRLAPENEQDLATQLWRSELDPIVAAQPGTSEARLVRRILDLMQLAGLAGIALSDLPAILEPGLVGQEHELPVAPARVGEWLRHWRSWCLDRGLLTYGIITDLYGQHLLPNRHYQEHLARRYRWLLADDVDEYPAIARSLFEVLLAGGTQAVFTYNPEGSVRLGLGADPDHLVELADRCASVDLDGSDSGSLAAHSAASLGRELDETVIQLVMDPFYFSGLPDSIQAIQTTSRAQLLRRTAEQIIEGIQTQQVEPRDIAIIAPGLEPIVRYSLIEILTKHQIPVESLNDQRPLASSPIIRALLTLLTLVYPGLGRLVDRDAVAEMLIVLGGPKTENSSTLLTTDSAPPFATTDSSIAASPTPHPASFLIDPVRAGLLADHCFAPHFDRPRLLPVTTFPRWDRLGYQASQAYESLVNWIDKQQEQLTQRLIPTPVALLDRAIQYFLMERRSLPFDQLAALRQLMETAQHYWEVNARLRRGERYDAPASVSVGRLIQLLRNGTVTANPFPVRAMGPASNAVTLANVFQYRSSRRFHRWQFWMDAGSVRWLSGVDALFGAPLLLQNWSGRPWTAADMMRSNERRLRRILRDLLGRAGERVYLCHSDLATNGQEQTGILLSLVNAAVPLSS